MLLYTSVQSLLSTRQGQGQDATLEGSAVVGKKLFPPLTSSKPSQGAPGESFPESGGLCKERRLRFPSLIVHLLTHFTCGPFRVLPEQGQRVLSV